MAMYRVHCRKGMKNTTLKLLSKLQTKYVNVRKMVPLSVKIWDRLLRPFLMNTILSQGRTTNLAWRMKLSKHFINWLLSYQKNHGAEATVKWLKASLVALQKGLGDDRLKSLVPLGSVCAYSKLAGGNLPRIIPRQCRGRIRAGDVKEIRFWTGLFNLYRVLQIPSQLKLSTITDPFKGHVFKVEEYFTLARQRNLFALLKGYASLKRNMNLVPQKFVLSNAASPSSKVSALGILTDIYLLNTYRPDLWQEMLYYLHAVGTKADSEILKLMDTGYQLINQILEWEMKDIPGKTGGVFYQSNLLQLKTSLREYGFAGEEGEGLSQFAIKDEAAGKARLFALIDSITQSILAPLHDFLFSVLRSIPNDGTFDQEASVRRGQEKALASGQAFSFDLTAATDRLPAALTAQILETMTGCEISESWLRLMTDRDFWFNGRVAEKRKVNEGPYRYAVGQPMGGLSSWAGLAITHHWIVQIAASKANKGHTWYLNYELLGDDLVIFDADVAREYLIIMEILGCEINLHKSIVSPKKPVFEFAKRTCVGNQIVSGISVAQVWAGWKVAGRVANALSFINTGLITSPVLLALSLSRSMLINRQLTTKEIFTKRSTSGLKAMLIGSLSLLGVTHHNGKLPLSGVMTALVNPHNSEADFSDEAIGLPLRASLNVNYNILVKDELPDPLWSHMDARTEVCDEYKTELATVTLQSALKRAKALYENVDKYVHIFAMRLIVPWYNKEDYKKGFLRTDLPDELNLLIIQLHNYTEWMLGLQMTNEHPEDIYDELYDLACKHAESGDHLVTYERARSLLDKVEQLEYKLKLPERVKPEKTILETAPILGALRNMDPNRNIRPTYIRSAEYGP
nr:putative RNA-dependent RNA polymerase [Rhizoctonia solani mitovirus IF]